MVSRNFHRFWLTYAGVFVVAETWAIVRHGEGYTLSEWVWSKIRSLPLRMAVGALLVWLIWHFLVVGPSRGLDRWNLVAVALGGAIGFAGFRWGWH